MKKFYLLFFITVFASMAIAQSLSIQGTNEITFGSQVPFGLGDIEELKRQLSGINLTLSKLEIKELARGKTNELEKTTSYLVTWQDWRWPCSEGDYCKFIGFPF